MYIRFSYEERLCILDNYLKMVTLMIHRWIYTCCHSQHSQQVDYTSRTNHGFRKPRECMLLYIIIISQGLRRKLNVSENSTCGTWMIILSSLLLVEYEKLIDVITILPAIQGILSFRTV